jgi:two-component system response regulator VanR
VITIKKALIINNTDNDVSYAPSSQLLIREGYDVHMVASSNAGLQQLDAQEYDLIIVHESPQAQSWQLCEEIRHLSRMPLIVISPNASADTCVKAINAGADYFLRKPFGPLEFMARVQSLLQRTSQNQPVPIGR